jgi:hypothetical protein
VLPLTDYKVLETIKEGKAAYQAKQQSADEMIKKAR